MTRWRRRHFLATLAALPGLGFARGDPVSRRKAKFGEIASSVQMTLSLPRLIRLTDAEALASIDSGFDTTLEFHVTLWEHGSREQVGHRVIVVKIGWNPFLKRYVVKTKGSTGWMQRTFTSRTAAIEAAVTLDRIRIAASDDLTRGTFEDGPYYFATVLAMRNPIKEDDSASARRRRRGDRDLVWFGHLVETLAGERARAEEVVHVRTNYFYLEAR